MNVIKNKTNNDFERIWIKIPYLSDKGDQVLKFFKKKLKHHFTNEVKFIIIQSTQKFSFYANTELKMKFSHIWSHLLKKSLMENFIFCAV